MVIRWLLKRQLVFHVSWSLLGSFLTPLLGYGTDSDVFSEFQCKVQCIFSPWQRRTCITFVEIHFWCDTCQPLECQYSGLPSFPHDSIMWINLYFNVDNGYTIKASFIRHGNGVSAVHGNGAVKIGIIAAYETIYTWRRRCHWWRQCRWRRAMVIGFCTHFSPRQRCRPRQRRRCGVV